MAATNNSITLQKALMVALAVVFLYLQFRIWVGEGSTAQIIELNREITQQTLLNEQLQQRNDRLYATVRALKHDPAAVEHKARAELGMIRRGETFFLVRPEAK